MTILDISLCLPELDIVALRQKRSIVAVTQRFIVPDRSFALLPCRISSETASSSYHAHVLADLESEVRSLSNPISATHWAQCVFCQPVDERAIATLSQLTIWTAESLSQRLQNGSLFLSFLRTYALPEAFTVESEPVCEQIYKFIPLPHHLEVSAESPAYSDGEFAVAKQEILEPKIEPEPPGNNAQKEETPEPVSILNSPNWIEKISEMGNSSNGYDFEKLVRKGLLTLGFSNSLNQPTASLDPEATGGAGGLDFYADRPYSLMGECKATAIGKPSTPAKQLYKLGIQWLGREIYEGSIKLAIAAGGITGQDEQFAKNSGINVISPETFQALVAFKMLCEESLNPDDLKKILGSTPFGKAADQKLFSFVQKQKKDFAEQEAASIAFKKSQRQGSQIVQTVKELSRQSIHQKRKSFSVMEVRSHYNAKYQPCLEDEYVEGVLSLLASPLAAGCLKRHSSSGSQDTYAFEKDMVMTDT
ncbi:MAG: hypothetical protein DCF25_18390 [Leptolyngbya foveolarum]|uniref:DUF1802 domain-containing protein n=1 Tax=Leptolyngbya foveolarum TaxID=47253 RepID=A0A2W4VQV0_9CYAN|nr:MAG: hypothetical protein DCF25_18390 [Leptolyngbya foveolarum]